MKEIKAAAKKSQATRLKAYTGGAAHPDEKADRALVNKMVKPSSLSGRAAGGKSPSKGKGKTQVNVIVAPHGGDRPVPVPIPVGVAQAGPGQAPSQAPAPSGPAMPAPPMRKPPMRVTNVPPPQGALGPVEAKRGGKIKKRANGGSVKFTAGSESGLGRLQKTAAQRNSK